MPIMISMTTNYIVSQNGKIFKQLSDTFENVVVYADKFAETHKGDWTTIHTADRPRKQVYIRCDEEYVREVLK